MDLDDAIRIFEQIECSCEKDETLLHLKREMVSLGIRYARIRTDWQLADPTSRLELDQERRATHNAFIDSCNILSRNMAKQGKDISWREELGCDRKDIGDFACNIHCFLGLRAR